uniref:ubiquitinyl hydrolase 1 n=1 Tax=Aotus nancymaae TaxID=37293 RepID=A0A2K5F6H9_AOTNA
MEFIFHEKQEGSLCAQHCLNNLFQGEYFSPVELASTAHQLDEEERMRMAEGGVSSEDYRAFLQQPSGNMDDTGFFSIQVIINALKFWGLDVILLNRSILVICQRDEEIRLLGGLQTKRGQNCRTK